MDRRGRSARPLDGEALERLAIFYVGRYATTRAKLRSYLKRKLRDRGWLDDAEPPVEPLIERLVGLGYVDDAAFASVRAASLQRRGYGERRIAQALAAAGIEKGDAEPVRAAARESQLEAALRFAERRRLGPYASAVPERAERERAFAAMMRAGHSVETIRKVLDTLPGEFPELESDRNRH